MPSEALNFYIFTTNHYFFYYAVHIKGLEQTFTGFATIAIAEMLKIDRSSLRPATETVCQPQACNFI